MPESRPQPDTSDDHCAVCHQTAPFIERQRGTGIVTRWCRTHLPWPEYKPSLTRLLEQEYLARHRNEASPPACA